MNLKLTLKKTYTYNKINGGFTHNRTHRTVVKKTFAGCPDPTAGGYIKMHLMGKYYYAHQLVFLWHTGYIPKEIDHKDHNPVNNLWGNLREVTHKINGQNQKKYKTNTSGTTGIRQRASGKWRARIYHEGVHIDLGTHSTRKAAENAREQALKKLKFHQNHGV